MPDRALYFVDFCEFWEALSVGQVKNSGGIVAKMANIRAFFLVMTETLGKKYPNQTLKLKPAGNTKHFGQLDHKDPHHH